MKKKKFLLVLAVPTVLCTLVAGALTGCGEKHEHTYTKWASNDTQHWLVCPDDSAKDENSVADHEFGTDGACIVCGYTEPHTHAYTKWKTSDTEHWKVCPEDNQEQAGSRAPHNFVNGECECGRKDNFSGEVTVNEKFNGKTVILKKDGQSDINLTVANGKVTLTNVKLGEWTATCNLFGTTVKTTVTVDESMSELDLSGLTSGTAKINMNTGSFTWHRQSHETVKMNLAEEASGDQYVALKIATGDDFLDWTKKQDEMRFGVSMTVNGAEHVINFNWRNWERTNIGFTSDIKNWQTENQDKDMGEVNYRGLDAVRTHLFNPKFQGWDDKEKGWGFGTYGGAIIDGGVYFVYQYEAATGNVNVYLSDGEGYILVYTEEEMFEKNGKFQGFGVTRGETDTLWAGGSHNSGIDREFTFTLGYGTTMNAAVGGEVSEWKSTVSITGNKADINGADVVADKTAYKYGETATITVTVPENTIATVTVDGGNPIVLETTDTITFTVLKTDYTVNVVFANDKFTGEVTVSEALNGKKITLTKEGETPVELTVSGGKVTLTKVKLGEWMATCELFGVNVKGKVLLTPDMTELDLSGFVTGTADMNLATGSFTWHRQSHETAKMNLAEEASGDQYVALKIATGSDFLDWTKKQDEMRFGVSMTVNGAEHVINFNWRNWERTNIGFTSDIKNWHTENQDKDMGEVNYRGLDAVRTHLFNPKFQGWDDKEKGWGFGTYGGAIIEDGVYFIYQYEASTGNVNVYLSDGEGYILVYTEEGMFEKNGKFQGFGVTKGEEDTKWAGGGWNTGIDREFTFTLGYGATMNAAVGGTVSEWKSTVTITSNKAEVDGANVAADKTVYEYGETATITVTVPANKIATVTVDGGTPVILEATDTITFTVIKTEYTVNVVFASEFTGEVTVGEAYNGKKITLTKEGETPVELTVANGKVTFTNIKLGEWTATCNLLGTILKGTVTITDGMTSLDLSGFNAGTADINLITGEFVYTSVKDVAPTVDIELAEAKTGDTYVGLKISTDNPWNDWTVNNFEELHLGVWMTVGETKHWVELHWRNWETAHFALNSDTAHDNENSSTGILKNTLWKPIDGFRFENHCWDEMPFGEAFMADGIYLVMKYDAATGNVDVLLAKSDGYVKVCTFEKMFAANGEVKAFGVGSIGEDYGYHYTPNGFKIDCVLSIGSSLQDITGSELSVLTITPVLEINSADIQGAVAVMNKTNYEVGEKGTLTVTVPKNSMATVTIGGITQDLYANSEITFTAYSELQINVVFKALDSITKQVEVNAKLNGTNLVLKRAGYDDVTLTVTDGKVSLNNVCTGPWDAVFTALGNNIKVECFINEEFEAFPWLGTADLNLQTGEFEYVSVKDIAPTVNVNLVEAKTGDTYVGLKISTDCTLQDLTNKYEELHLGVWMTVGDNKHWVELHWRNWQARSLGIHTDANHNDGGSGSDTLKDLLWKPTFVGDEGGSSYGDGNHNWELSPFGEAFLGDGIYLIMKYEAATGNVDVLLAKSDGYVKVCTFEKMFEANSEIKGFGVGAIGDDWGYHETPNGFKIDCVLSVGSSLQDITGNELNEWTAPATTTPEE